MCSLDDGERDDYSSEESGNFELHGVGSNWMGLLDEYWEEILIQIPPLLYVLELPSNSCE